MPNWCYNRVVIRGNNARRESIQSFLEGLIYTRPFKGVETDENDQNKPKFVYHPMQGFPTAFSFHNVIPQPDNLLDPADPRRRTDVPQTENKDGPMPDWYEWRLENWGTKWDVTEVEVSTTNSTLTYEFDTAWAPPTPVIQKLSALFPDVRITLHYNEPGMGFGGSIVFKDGYVIKETEKSSV